MNFVRILLQPQGARGGQLAGKVQGSQLGAVAGGAIGGGLANIGRGDLEGRFQGGGGGKRCLPERAERGEVADLRQVNGRPPLSDFNEPA